MTNTTNTEQAYFEQLVQKSRFLRDLPYRFETTNSGHELILVLPNVRMVRTTPADDVQLGDAVFQVVDGDNWSVPCRRSPTFEMYMQCIHNVLTMWNYNTACFHTGNPAQTYYLKQQVEQQPGAAILYKALANNEDVVSRVFHSECYASSPDRTDVYCPASMFNTALACFA